MHSFVVLDRWRDEYLQLFGYISSPRGACLGDEPWNWEGEWDRNTTVGKRGKWKEKKRGTSIKFEKAEEKERKERKTQPKVTFLVFYGLAERTWEGLFASSLYSLHIANACLLCVLLCAVLEHTPWQPKQTANKGEAANIFLVPLYLLLFVT